MNNYYIHRSVYYHSMIWRRQMPSSNISSPEMESLFLPELYGSNKQGCTPSLEPAPFSSSLHPASSSRTAHKSLKSLLKLTASSASVYSALVLHVLTYHHYKTAPAFDLITTDRNNTTLKCSGIYQSV